MKIKRFEELKIWKLVLIYNLTNKKKLSKDFKLRDQIRSAIISVSSNIVEGFEKIITMSLLGFLKIAKGSTGEARNQLYIALIVRYINQKEFNKANKELENLANQIGKLISYLERFRKQRKNLQFTIL